MFWVRQNEKQNPDSCYLKIFQTTVLNDFFFPATVVPLSPISSQIISEQTMCVYIMYKFHIHVLRGSKNFTAIFQNCFDKTFRIDWIPVIICDISDISFTHLIHQTCSQFSATGQGQCFKARVILIVFMFSSNLVSLYFEVMRSHYREWLLSCINHSLTSMAHW